MRHDLPATPQTTQRSEGGAQQRADGMESHLGVSWSDRAQQRAGAVSRSDRARTANQRVRAAVERTRNK